VVASYKLVQDHFNLNVTKQALKPGASCTILSLSHLNSVSAFLLPARRPFWAVWAGAVLDFACTGFSDVVALASQLCYLVSKRSGGWRVGEGEQKACHE
jgi:hypothetical protein